MKNIAVLLYELTIEYNSTVVDGVVDFFENKDDVNLIISSVNIPRSNSSEFDYQYWTGTDILTSDDIDAVIVITNSFLSYISIDTLSDALKKFCSKPIVSVSVPLNIPESRYTYVKCDDAYDKIVEHLVTKHKCTKIGFFTAAMTYSKESDERFNAYKNALKKYGLEFNPDFVIDGDFTPGIAEEKFLERFKCKEDVCFQAILCANDCTATGVLTAAEKIGLKCPEDLIIFGFDDTEFALASYPTLSTINQSIEETGYEAAKMIYDLVHGKEVESSRPIFAEPIYRQSCGCIDYSIRSNFALNKNGELVTKDRHSDVRLENYSRNSSNFMTIYGLLNQMDTTADLYEYLENMRYNFGLNNVSELSVVFYKNPICVEKNDDFIMPDQANLVFFSNKGIKVCRNFLASEEYVFNPKKSIIPNEFFNKDKGRYMLFPLYSRKMNYGYIVYMFYSHNYSLMSIYGKILSNSLLQAYFNYQNSKQRNDLLQENKNLSITAKMDELTKLFNRRGFYEYGQKTINLSISMDKEGCVFFCDLDGLKKINDNFGHDMGDIAIQSIAEVLKIVFRESDIVARLSGDEFGIIAPSFKIENLDSLRKKVNEENVRISKEKNLPFTLSLSIGCAEFGIDHSNLSEILIAADEKLYEEKRLKHGKNKNSKKR